MCIVNYKKDIDTQPLIQVAGKLPFTRIDGNLPVSRIDNLPASLGMALTGTNGTSRILFYTGQIFVPSRALIYQDGIKLSSVGETNNFTIPFGNPYEENIANKHACAVITRAKTSDSRANMCFCVSPSANNNQITIIETLQL